MWSKFWSLDIYLNVKRRLSRDFHISATSGPS